MATKHERDTDVQAVLALRKIWPLERFEAWLEKNGYRHDVEESAAYWVAVQAREGRYEKIRTRTTSVGLLFRIGVGRALLDL